MDISKKYSFNIDIDKERVFSNKGILKNFSTEELHYHNYHQLLLIKNGVSLFEQKKYRVPQYSNMAAFIPAGSFHRTKTIGKKVSYQSLYFHKEYFKIIDEHIAVFNMSNLGVELLHRLCEKILVTLKDGFYGKCFSLIIHIIKEDIKKNNQNIILPMAENQHNKKIISYIEDNFSEKISLEKISSVVPFTARHISRLFKKELNITIFDYLKLYRLLQASVELQTTDKSVTEIIYSSGYESPSSFYNDFKTFFSRSPKDFRIL